MKKKIIIQNQLGLFDDSNILKTELKNNLANGDFENAINSLTKLQYISKDEMEFVNILSCLKHLKVIISNNKNKLLSLYDLYKTFEKNEKLMALEKNKHDIKKGLEKIIVDLINLEDYNFLDSTTHPAWFLIKAQKYDKAIKIINTYLSNIGENSLLRQYLAFSCSKINDPHNAGINLAIALFNNPVYCDSDFIFGNYNINLFHSIRKSLDNKNHIWVNFTFQLWLENRISIDFRAPLFEKYLMVEIKNRELDAIYKSNMVLFLNYLYIAELYRKKEKNYDQMIIFREKMKNINYSLFDKYMKYIHY